MKAIGIIPARMGSSRFPNKPMATLLGMPMIGHCYHRTNMAPGIEKAYVATCDQVIEDYVQSIGGFAVMTATTHNRPTTRTAEALEIVEQQTGQRFDIVVMVQGDEPMDTPQMISEALAPMLADERIDVVNLVSPISSTDEFEDPNTVKVVVDSSGNALYFSREPIPSRKKWSEEVPMQKQVCVIPFRRDYLLKFNSTPETPLEKIESVDMLRVLESGGKVKMIPTTYPSIGVDTPQHLERVADLMREDTLMKGYLS